MKKTILALMAVATLGGASDNASALSTMGVRSCGEWVADSKDAYALIRESWLIGYVSGLVVGTGKDFLRGTDIESLFSWVTSYCKKNPLDDLADAGNAFGRELVNKKGIK